MLAVAQIEVISAEDGLSGIQMFVARKDDVEAVLLDLSMPGLSGKETLAALRKIDPDVPVILTSGFTESAVEIQINEYSNTDFVKKPYRMDSLIKAVDRCMR